VTHTGFWLDVVYTNDNHKTALLSFRSLGVKLRLLKNGQSLVNSHKRTPVYKHSMQ